MTLNKTISTTPIPNALLLFTGLKHAVWSVPGSNLSVTEKLENCYADLDKELHVRVFGHKKKTP